MGLEANGAITGLILGALFAALIGSLVGAVILRMAAGWAEDLDIPFGSAYGTIFLTYLINIAIGFPLEYMANANGVGDGAKLFMQVVMFAVGFLIQAAMISGRHDVSFAKGAKITGYMLLVGLMIALVIGVVIFGVFLATKR